MSENQVCLNCAAPLIPDARFCIACAQRTDIGRISMRTVGADLSRAYFNLERGAVRSIRDLIVRPEVVIRNYLAGARIRYFSPTGFLIANVAFASLVIAFTGYQFVTTDGVPTASVRLFQHNPNLVFLLQVPILALLCRILFFDAHLNYAEFLVIAAYTSGVRTLFFSVVALPVWVLIKDSPILPTAVVAYVVLWVGYFSFAVRSLVPGRALLNWVRGVVAVILTLLGSTFVLVWLVT